MSKPAPNYTQVPNWFLDNIQDLSLAELKVILSICRFTFGYHKDKAKLSISNLERFTGLTHKSVISGTLDLVIRGWIIRTPKGKSFEYEMDLEAISPLVEQVSGQILPGSVVSSVFTVEQVSGQLREQVSDIKETGQTNPETNFPASGEGVPVESKKSKTKKGDPRHTPFIKAWHEAYYLAFDSFYSLPKYEVLRLKEFLIGYPQATVDDLISVAQSAWPKRADKNFFNCRHSIQIHSFLKYFNAIRDELSRAGLIQGGPVNERLLELQNRKPNRKAIQ